MSGLPGDSAGPWVSDGENLGICGFSTVLVVCGDSYVCLNKDLGYRGCLSVVCLSIETSMAWMYIQVNKRDWVEERKLDDQASDPGK